MSENSKRQRRKVDWDYIEDVTKLGITEDELKEDENYYDPALHSNETTPKTENRNTTPN